MFFSDIKIADKYDYLEDKFLSAYKWLKEQDLKSLDVVHFLWKKKDLKHMTCFLMFSTL